MKSVKAAVVEDVWYPILRAKSRLRPARVGASDDWGRRGKAGEKGFLTIRGVIVMRRR